MRINQMEAMFNANKNEFSSNPKQFRFVLKTIDRYAKPHSFCEALSWICYRIKNAIQNLFGCSDWQRAHKLLKKELCPFNSYHEMKVNKPKNFKIKMFNFLNHYSNQFADITLTMLLKIRENSEQKCVVICKNYQVQLDVFMANFERRRAELV